MKRLFRALLLGAAFTAFAASPASAALTVNILNSGPNVTATLSGSFNLTGLTSQGSFSNSTFIRPEVGFIGFGSGSVQGYSGLTGPTNWGSGTAQGWSSNSGDLFAINSSSFGSPFVFFSSSYVSGSALNGTDTWLANSIGGLGLTPGTYVYTAGNQDTITINVGSVPEPGTWAMMLLGFGAIGFVLRRKRSSPRNRATA